MKSLTKFSMMVLSMAATLALSQVAGAASAVAVSTNGKSSFSASVEKTEQQVKVEAVETCKSAGGQGCQVAGASPLNGVVIVAAHGPNKYTFGFSNDLSAATKLAMSKCQQLKGVSRCEIADSFLATPERKSARQQGHDADHDDGTHSKKPHDDYPSFGLHAGKWGWHSDGPSAGFLKQECEAGDCKWVPGSSENKVPGYVGN